MARYNEEQVVHTLSQVSALNSLKMKEDFAVNFNIYFTGTNLRECNIILRMCIARIIVDREEEAIMCHLNPLVCRLLIYSDLFFCLHGSSL
jgi:hypothetical protein